ncbi:MAG: DNA repair protein RecN [Lachnospiraceae bacterium]|nr:DNA repair protein RecN [Lachnospiraceae bacterium]
MLINVNVKNLALIDHADVYFSEGLNIMSGETGAGKSIIIGSILIALGGKLPKDILRNPEKPALAELVFQISDEEVVSKLRDMSIELDPDNTLVISRKIVNGRSTIRVNGETFTINNLRKITELLIDIHGQHDHQSLLKVSKQLDILDDFASDSIDKIKSEINTEFHNYQNFKNELSEFDIDNDSRQREISFCEFEINEIDNAHLIPGEYDETEKKFKMISSSKDIITKLNSVYYNLAEDNGSVMDRLTDAGRELNTLRNFGSEFDELSDSLQTVENLCDDIKREISSYIDTMTFDADDAKNTEVRFNELNLLRQKYEKETVSDDPVINIINYKNKQSENLENLLNFEERKKDLNKRLLNSEEHLTKLCSKLTDIRKKKAYDLSKKIEEVLKGLNFLDAKFEIKFDTKKEFSSNGKDEIKFMISTNPGEALRPLNEVASGGELSRIMLGIKTIMASKDRIDTLIFDEIDTGISGKTAQLVAIRLKELSKIHQVICITHLPQIASMADRHFLIEKSAVNNITTSNILELSEEESIDELARMLSGVKITDAVRQNAIELKKLNNVNN